MTIARLTLFFIFVNSKSLALPRPINPSIVGGTEAIRGEFPFIVEILRPDHFCGGSIVTSEWIVTAAHCAQAELSTYEIIAGEHRIDLNEGTEQSRRVIQIINHPNYNPLTIENDIALMKVSPPFQFNKFVKPIVLAPNRFPPTAVQTAIGWGRLTEGGTLSNVLMKVDVPYVTDRKCRQAYGSRIKPSMLCAGEEGRDACQGDSGGALICKLGNLDLLCGITSWGSGCAREDYAGVYTEVSYFNSWVFRTIL